MRFAIILLFALATTAASAGEIDDYWAMRARRTTRGGDPSLADQLNATSRQFRTDSRLDDLERQMNNIRANEMINRPRDLPLTCPLCAPAW